MKKINLILMLLLFTGWVGAQKPSVVDRTTRQPIPGVAVYSENMKVSTVTNSKGEIDASIFRSSDSIYFRLVGYETYMVTFKQLEAMKYKVEMTEKKISLNEVVVSANRWEENKIENPNRIEKLNMKEVSFQNPQTSADLLGTNPYVFIQKSQLAGGSPTLRGFATNRVMIVVDGVRINNAIYRTGNIQNVISLDANSLEGAEILFGPGAIMYGSDAIGGVMDFHTMQPKLSDGKKPLITGGAFGRFSSANLERTGHIDLCLGLKKLAYAGSFTYSYYDDLHTGSKGNSYFLRPTYQETINGVDSTIINKDPNLQVHSGFSQFNIMQKILYKPNEFWDINYGFHFSKTSDAPRYDRLYLDANDDGKLDYAQWYYGPQKWMMNRFGITYSKENALFNQIRFVAAMQNYEESRNDRKTGKSKLRTQTENVTAVSFNLDFDKNIGKKVTLFYGAEAIYNKIGSKAINTHIVTLVEEPTTTRYPNGSTWQAYGAYANLKFKFNSKWIINGGLRYSHYIVKADFDTTMFPFPFTNAQNNHGALNGSIGAVYNPNNTWQIYINGSTGFRAPNVDDIGKVFSSGSGSVVVPNADLKPEYAYNGEIGTAKTFGNFLKVDFSAYFTLLDNALARRDFQFNGKDSIIYDGELSRVQAIQNITRAYVYGIEAGVNISVWKGIGLSSAVCYQKGEEQSEDSLKYYPLSHITPLFGNAHLTYERKKLKFDFYVVYNLKMEFEDLPLTDRTDNTPYAKDADGNPFVPGWYTLNFKAAWYINRYVAINFGIENLTDQLYRPYSSGISASGRNFIAAVKCKF